jgi:hypothetical protein
MKKILILSILGIIVVVVVSFWSIVSGGYDKQNKTIIFLKKFIPTSLAREVRDKIFFIPKLQDRNKFLETQLDKYEQGLNGNLFFEKNVKLDENYNYNLKKFYLPFPSLDLTLGWNATQNSKRAHYLEVFDKKILAISGAGKTIYFDQENVGKEKLEQKNLPNNLNETLKNKGSELSSIRDLYFENDYFYVSVVEQIGGEYTLNIYRAQKNLNNLNFEIFFESKEYSKKYTLQTGGRIEKFNKDEILLSVGYFNKYDLVQQKDSIVGKIISINKTTKKYNLMSLGHRNPQGLFFIEDKNIIVNSEHGPQGGDEINFNYVSKKGPKNFGWPISSYGVPYPHQDKAFFEKRGYLKKSHNKYGFEEPWKQFTPSIGISEIIYANNKIYASSLRAESIYVIETNDDNSIQKTKRLKFDHRIRDLKYDEINEIFYILFENIPAVGVLKFT